MEPLDVIANICLPLSSTDNVDNLIVDCRMISKPFEPDLSMRSLTGFLVKSTFLPGWIALHCVLDAFIAQWNPQFGPELGVPKFSIRNGRCNRITAAQPASEHLQCICALDASLRTIIAESSFHAPVHQRGWSLSTRNADAVEQTPLRAPAHRGVDGAFLHHRRAETRRIGCLVCFAWTRQGLTKGDHGSKRQNENAVHRVTM